MESRGQYGLISARAFFPAQDGPGTIAICECVFADEAAMADVVRFTDATPERSRAVQL